MKQKLPKIFKRKWIAALRSGEYEQAPEVLYNGKIDKIPQCCCLGVAGFVCGMKSKSLLGKSLFALKGIFNDCPQQLFTAKQIKNLSLPKALIGSNKERGTDFNPIVKRLVYFNDGGKSFKWIASWIEKNL